MIVMIGLSILLYSYSINTLCSKRIFHSHLSKSDIIATIGASLSGVKIAFFLRCAAEPAKHTTFFTRIRISAGAWCRISSTLPDSILIIFDSQISYVCTISHDPVLDRIFQETSWSWLPVSILRARSTSMRSEHTHDACLLLETLHNRRYQLLIGTFLLSVHCLLHLALEVVDRVSQLVFHRDRLIIQHSCGLCDLTLTPADESWVEMIEEKEGTHCDVAKDSPLGQVMGVLHCLLLLVLLDNCSLKGSVICMPSVGQGPLHEARLRGLTGWFGLSSRLRLSVLLGKVVFAKC